MFHCGMFLLQTSHPQWSSMLCNVSPANISSNISSSMVFNGCHRLMVVCAICRMCTQLAMIHFSKGKLFISKKTFAQQTQLWEVLSNETELQSRGGWLVNDPVRPQTNIYANTSNAAISDPALPCQAQRDRRKLFVISFQ